jgi:hypothetical protein
MYSRIVIYIISGIKAILQDSSVKIADDDGVSPSSSVTHEFPVICFSPRVMYYRGHPKVNGFFNSLIFTLNHRRPKMSKFDTSVKKN